MLKFLQRYRYGWVLIFYLILTAAYFIPSHVPLNLPEPIVVHIPLDDWFPFCELFIVPYVFWYLYVGGSVVFFLFTERKTFLQLMMFIFFGMSISVLMFFIFPTVIDFRPESFERHNVFTWVTSLIYSSDPPMNCYPSIHCLNSFATHLAIRNSAAFRNRPGIRIASLIITILICLSTFFVKQHSVLDLFGAIILAIPIYFIVYRIPWSFLQEKKAPETP